MDVPNIYEALNIDPDLITAISVAYGLLMVLFGYKLFKLYVFCIGAVVGFLLARSISGNVLMEIAAALACGLISMILWYLGVFLAGAAIGAILCFSAGINSPIIVAIAAIAAGILAIAIRKFFIIVSTSFTGAASLVQAAAHYIDMSDSVVLSAEIVIAIAGIIFQYSKGAGKATPKPETAKPDELDEQDNSEE